MPVFQQLLLGQQQQQQQQKGAATEWQQQKLSEWQRHFSLVEDCRQDSFLTCQAGLAGAGANS